MKRDMEKLDGTGRIDRQVSLTGEYVSESLQHGYQEVEDVIEFVGFYHEVIKSQLSITDRALLAQMLLEDCGLINLAEKVGEALI